MNVFWLMSWKEGVCLVKGCVFEVDGWVVLMLLDVVGWFWCYLDEVGGVVSFDGLFFIICIGWLISYMIWRLRWWVWIVEVVGVGLVWLYDFWYIVVMCFYIVDRWMLVEV